MNINYTFRHMESSPAAREFVETKLQRLKRLLEHEHGPINVEVVLEAAETHHHHKVEIRLKTPNYDIIAQRQGPEMYAVIDQVVDVLHQELIKAKEKRVDANKQRERPGKE